MSVDLKTLTPDTSIADSAVLFGADSQASSTPSVYAVSTLRTHIVGTANTFTEPQIVSVNSASTAFRITQTGAGNALVVEDSANPDATPFVVNADGRVLCGLTTPVTTLFSNSPGVQINAQFGVQALALMRFSANQFGADVDFVKSRNATPGSHTIVNSGDQIANLNFAGSDGTAFVTAATIAVNVDGTPGLNDMPGRLVFSTTADGAASPTERMRITSAGNVGIGTTSFGTSATRTLTIGTGIAPTTGPADTIQIYSTDLSAGNTILSLYTEGTPVNANTTAAATHRIAVRINGTVYYLLANTAA